MEKAEFDNKKEEIIEALKRVYDPEIPVNIYDMGLVYEVDIQDSGNVTILMTLTTPNCPEGATIPQFVEACVGAVEWVNKVYVEIVWDPPWTVDRMSEAAKLQLNL